MTASRISKSGRVGVGQVAGDIGWGFARQSLVDTHWQAKRPVAFHNGTTRRLASCTSPLHGMMIMDAQILHAQMDVLGDAGPGVIKQLKQEAVPAAGQRRIVRRG